MENIFPRHRTTLNNKRLVGLNSTQRLWTRLGRHLTTQREPIVFLTRGQLTASNITLQLVLLPELVDSTHELL